MSKKIGTAYFGDLLPDSISRDPKIEAAAKSLDRLLIRTSRSVPNLLIWARLDRDDSRLIPPLARLTESAGGLKPLSLEMLELLAWQLHVDFREVAAGRDMLERMVRESIPWHRLKGTPAAVEQALAMYGVKALTDESGTGRNWAVYELELEVPPTTPELINIVRVAGMSAPKRCWLRRVHDQYDRRPIVLDVGPALDVGFLDDDSGRWNEEAGVKESFGRTLALASEKFFAKGFGGLALEELRPTLIYYLNRPILDKWALDNPTIRTHGMTIHSLMVLISAPIEGFRGGWHGPWDKRKWSETGTTLPRRYLHTRTEVSKSQMVLDWGRLDNPLEKMDRPWGPVPAAPMVLDKSKLDWSDSNMGNGLAYFDELFLDERPLAAAPAEITSTRGIAAEEIRAIQSAPRPAEKSGGTAITGEYWETCNLGCPPPRQGWQGPWSGSWYPQAYINVIHEEKK